VAGYLLAGLRGRAALAVQGRCREGTISSGRLVGPSWPVCLAVKANGA
jgi:hypothetical protein